MGYYSGKLGIFDIQKYQTIQTIQIMQNYIHSVTFTKNNQGAYISDRSGNIKMIKWTPNASSEHDFDLTQNSTQLCMGYISEICLTKDEKNLLFGLPGLLGVFNTEIRNVTKEFILSDYVMGIKLVNDGKNALIAEENGDLTIIDLETLKITQSHKNTIDLFLSQISVI